MYEGIRGACARPRLTVEKELPTFNSCTDSGSVRRVVYQHVHQMTYKLYIDDISIQ